MRAMLSLALVLAALPLRFVASAQAAAAPHIVLVVSDDLGFNDLGAYPCPARTRRPPPRYYGRWQSLRLQHAMRWQH